MNIYRLNAAPVFHQATRAAWFIVDAPVTPGCGYENPVIVVADFRRGIARVAPRPDDLTFGEFISDREIRRLLDQSVETAVDDIYPVLGLPYDSDTDPTAPPVEFFARLDWFVDMDAEPHDALVED